MTEKITSRQARQIARFVENAAFEAVERVLEENLPDKEGAQEIIARGDAMKMALLPIIKQGVEAFITGSSAQQINPRCLLDIIDTIAVPSTTERFVAKEHFIVDTSPQAIVKISYLGDVFSKEFLNVAEGPFTGSTLRYGQLNRDSVDGPIIDELGGAKEAVTTLTELWNLIARQPNGEEGVLLTNGYANIFYIRNSSGLLRAVYVHWLGDGWRVLAPSVEYPYEWHAGDRVFSRDS